MTKAIIYYTSNREDEGFEQRVRDNILEVSGGLPIISVSHKPIDFGRNICVGDVGVSGFNMFRQVQIALENTDADLVISAESDCLYPPDYFEFTPDRVDTCYRTSTLYVMPDKRSFFFHKAEGATHAQIVGRKFYLNRLNTLFDGAPQWSEEEKNFPRERGLGVDIFDTVSYYELENPVVQIKSHRGMRYYTHSERIPIQSIPYWGDGRDFKKKYYYGD